MQPCTFEQLAQRSGGKLLKGNPQMEVKRVQTDSRTVQPGDCFFAMPPLPDYRLDGHDYILDAVAKGAVGAVVSTVPKIKLPADFGLIEVADTYAALQRFAGEYRGRMPARIVGITGSNGKTSTKEMIAQLLGQHFHVHATKGNLNTQVGVPMTVLDLSLENEVGVIEMGISRPGEMKGLVKAVQPDVGVITMIGVGHHLEFLKSSEGVAMEKSELIASLPESGYAFLNADDPWTEKIAKRTKAIVVLAGFSEKASWRAKNVKLKESGLTFTLHHEDEKVEVEMGVFSRAMISNALLAAAVAGDAFDLTLEEIAQGLKELKLPAARMQVISVDGKWILNDAHSASRDSTLVALATLKEFPAKGRKFAVLGSIGEQGAHAEPVHLEIGKAAAALPLEHLVVMGPHAEIIERGAHEAGFPAKKITRCSDHEETYPVIKNLFTKKEDCVLIKGSRARKLEIVVHKLGGPVPPHLPD